MRKTASQIADERKRPNYYSTIAAPKPFNSSGTSAPRKASADGPQPFTATALPVEPKDTKGANFESILGDYYKQSFNNSTMDKRWGELAKRDASLDDYKKDTVLRTTTKTYLGASATDADIDKEIESAYKSQNPGFDASAISSAVTGALTDMAASNKATAADEYSQDIAYWQEQGKYWFDPNADLRPDLGAYMSQMPSATDALGESTMLSGFTNTPPDGSVDASDVGGVLLNPAGFLGDQGAYVGENAIDRSTEGFAVGGWIGAIAGGLIGAVEGLFNWSAAEDADKKTKAKALDEYNKKMMEWTYNRNKRLSAQKDAYLSAVKDAKMANVEKGKQEKEIKDAKKNMNTTMRRQAMIEALASAGDASEANRQERINRWR